jgi:branched-chain amino acid transport system ATP-binding protein
MLAIARALVGGPTVLMLDEPSQGLAPVIVESVMQVIGGLRREGLSILLVEQNVEMATALATRHYVIDEGRIVFDGTTAELQRRADVWERYFALGADGR